MDHRVLHVFILSVLRKLRLVERYVEVLNVNMYLFLRKEK